MRKLTIFLVIISIVASITGCSGVGTVASAQTPNSLGIVLGIHDNFCAIPAETLNQPIYDCAYSYGSCSTVISEGMPSISANYVIKKPHANINDAKRRQLADQYSAEILTGISSLKATSPEVDTLKAITTAANSLNSTTVECSKKLIIIDSGLSTTGLINFADTNIIDNSPEYIIEQLQDFHALPDLQGVNVTWIGLGQTAGDQTEISASYKYKLQTLWDAILTASGANVSFVSKELPKEIVSNDLPHVSVVPIVEDCLALDSNHVPETVKFDENSSVKFNGDQATFVDTAAAEKELKPIADYLVTTGENMYIVGMTATHGDPIQRKQLSLARSEACKQVLVNYGVSPDKLIAVGLGFDDNVLRVKDTDTSGNLIEEQAKINRAVYFIKPTSSLVNLVINN